jgi:hypothetical protein
MKRFWIYFTGQDVKTIAAVIVVVGLFGFIAIKFPSFFGGGKGIGPDWDCDNVGAKQVFCVKKPFNESTAPAAQK